jgi:hypothetical protein
METNVIYCAACDRQVRVAFVTPPQVADEGGAEVDPNGICIDYCSSACTGSMCPLFNLPPAEMLERLRESGILPAA